MPRRVTLLHSCGHPSTWYFRAGQLKAQCEEKKERECRTCRSQAVKQRLQDRPPSNWTQWWWQFSHVEAWESFLCKNDWPLYQLRSTQKSRLGYWLNQDETPRLFVGWAEVLGPFLPPSKQG